MTPDEALLALKRDLPNAIDQVVAEGVGQTATRERLVPLAAQLRASNDLEHSIDLDNQVDQIAKTDVPVYDRLMALTKGVRDKADSETIPGQLREAAKDVKAAADTALTIVEAVALGWIVLKLSEHL
jgi:hypothetical protein